MVGRAIIICSTGLLAATAAAQAETRYDATLERAVMDVVAGRMGDLRPGFAAGQEPDLMALQPEPLAQPAETGAWHIARPDQGWKTSSAGSIQTYSDGSSLTRAERRKLAAKSVSRIINF